MVQPRFLIIGAGVVGSALADELTALGYTEVTVVDRGPLAPGQTPMTGGSSSHAPGLVFQTNPSRTMAEFAHYTATKFRSLNTADSLCFNTVGGLEVATTPERLADLHRKAGWAQVEGIEAAVVDVDECVRLHPLIDRDIVLGGLHTPADGLAGAPAAIGMQMRRAIDRGATFFGGQQVIEISQRAGVVTGVRTTERTFEADVVVSCAGFWGAELGNLVGLRVPLVPMGHQYAKTTALPVLRDHRDQARGHADARLPILRHQDADLYYRQHGEAVGIGYYGHRPMPVDMASLEELTAAQPMPSMLPFTDTDFAPAWTESMRLLPALAEVGVVEGFNGIFSFTPDGGPMMGEHPALSGFWVAEAVWVTHSAGVARTMARWITAGTPDLDLHGCDLARFTTPQLSVDYVADTSAQAFVEVYDIIHPRDQRSVQRGVATSPFHARHVDAGAVFHTGREWERPAWFESNAGMVDCDVTYPRDGWAGRNWSPIVPAEALATRRRVGLYDMTSLMRIEVTGADATNFLDRMLTRTVRRPIGTVIYALLLDESGGVRSDVTVARLGENTFQLGINGPMDIDWLQRHRADADVTVTDITAATCCVGVWGPLARELVAPLCSIDLYDTTLGYYQAARAIIGGIPVTMMRISYVGELGWEIYADAAHGELLWDTLADAGEPLGAVWAGRGALDVLRLEKGYRAWGTDVDAEMSPEEAGLSFAVGKKHDFLGRHALEARVVRSKLHTLVARDPQAIVMGGEPVSATGQVVGVVTSAAYSALVGRTICYARLAPHLSVGDTVAVEYFGELLDFAITEPVLVDPEGARVKGLIGVNN